MKEPDLSRSLGKASKFSNSLEALAMRLIALPKQEIDRKAKEYERQKQRRKRKKKLQ